MAAVVFQRDRGCELKGLLRSCGKPSVGFCQYCGAHFCQDHGVLLDDHQQVCLRKPCVAKRDDLAVHVVYREAVRTRNLTRQCGIDDCEGGIETQCRPCRGYYCRSHTEIRMVESPDSAESGQQYICEHCWKRRPIWLKR